MDDRTEDALVNRNEAVPVIAVAGNDSSSSDLPKGKRERLKESLSGSALKESLAGTTSKLKDKLHETSSGSSKDYGYSLQDRLFTK